jgi:rRNA maturation protein Nop10
MTSTKLGKRNQMTRTLTLSFLLFCACCGVATSQAVPSFQFSFRQPFGKYAVGLKVMQQYDPERAFSANSGETPNSKRPLQTLVWYPAMRSQTAPMVLGDFEDLIARVCEVLPIMVFHRGSWRQAFGLLHRNSRSASRLLTAEAGC